MAGIAPAGGRRRRALLFPLSFFEWWWRSGFGKVVTGCCSLEITRVVEPGIEF